LAKKRLTIVHKAQLSANDAGNLINDLHRRR